MSVVVVLGSLYSVSPYRHLTESLEQNMGYNQQKAWNRLDVLGAGYIPLSVGGYT